MASLWVDGRIMNSAEVLIKKNDAESLKKGVEMLLQNDLNESAKGRVDAGALLKLGLSLIVSHPYDALGVPVGADVADVRKAWKKMALKYHPDKNPKCTPLFQAIQTACEKLSDPELRAKEDKNAASDKKPPSKSSTTGPSSTSTKKNVFPLCQSSIIPEAVSAKDLQHSFSCRWH